MSPRDLLRLIATGGAGWYLARLVLFTEAADAGVRDGDRVAFGSGSTWGHFDPERAGLAVYVQGPPVVREVIPWAFFRHIRMSADPYALDELTAAVKHAATGPRYVPDRLPPHLYPENRDPALTDEAWVRACRAVHEQWRVEHHEPYRRFQEAATRRRDQALYDVLTPPADLLDLLSEMNA